MKKLLICASMIALSASAFAADKIGDVYVRADVGAFIQANKIGSNNDPFNDGEKFKNAPVFGVGVGYNILDDVRADINLQHRNLKYSENVDAVFTKQKTKNYTVFANAYYDFKNDTIFTPYVTAGLGMARNAAGNAISNDGGTLYTYPGKTTYNFAWNAGLGSNVAISESVDLDLGYKYTHLGKIKLKDATVDDTAKSPVKLKAHEFTVGVIYKF